LKAAGLLLPKEAAGLGELDEAVRLSSPNLSV